MADLLRIPAGERTSAAWRYTEADGVTPVATPGWACRFRVGRELAGAELEVQGQVGEDQAVVDDAGRAVVTISAATAAAITWRWAYFAVELIDPDDPAGPILLAAGLAYHPGALAAPAAP